MLSWYAVHSKPRQEEQAQLQLQRQQSAVSLVQALGGGWQAPWGQAAPAG